MSLSAVIKQTCGLIQMLLFMVYSWLCSVTTAEWDWPGAS